MKQVKALDSLGAWTPLDTDAGRACYYRLGQLMDAGVADVSKLPMSIRVLLEAVMRAEDGKAVTRDDVDRLAKYNPKDPQPITIPFKPARVLLQDFTGVPCVVDLAALRSAVARLGGDPKRINPQIPVDLVIDHSIQVDHYASGEAMSRNAAIEFERNRERYEFLRWGQSAFENFRVIPPNRGICHQVNLEYLGQVVQRRALSNGEEVVFPDSLLGTDSHTPMINSLGIVGWGVGGIEAEAIMLGQPLYMLAPKVVGFQLKGRLSPGATATDLVLTITQMLRLKGVVGKFVEFYGNGLSSLTVPDRATIANMAPEYGARMGYFPVDEQTLRYLRNTGRPEELIQLVERYCKEQGLFRTDDTPAPQFEDTVVLDLEAVQPSLAGPKRPQDRVSLGDMKATWRKTLRAPFGQRGFELEEEAVKRQISVASPDGTKADIRHGSVAIAAITSCTNTSNPSVMIAAGLLARKAAEAGLRTRPWVKTSLAPGSMMVTGYLAELGLLPYLEQLGFHVVGYGCTTCIGNSGPLPEHIVKAVTEGDLVVASVLSGNRNFEGRINPHTRANFLASPPLVVAYALAGTVDVDLALEPIGTDQGGSPVYLKDIWPTAEEVHEYVDRAFQPELFRQVYGGLEQSSEEWNQIPIRGGTLYEWQSDSTYIQQPPFFVSLEPKPGPIAPIREGRVLVVAGDSLTTDHISPAGAIPSESPAGRYLIDRGVAPADFNSYGSRRGNDRVMTRGTFANIRLRNLLAPGTEGGWTTHLPTGEVVSVHEASTHYHEAGTPTLVLGGKDYGMGSSRDWAAKGSLLLGIKAVIAESFESIHRSNLVNMGVLPLQFTGGDSVRSLGLTGSESYTVHLNDDLQPGQKVPVDVVREDGTEGRFHAICRIDIPIEVEYYRNGGILQYVLRRFLEEQKG